MGIKSLTQTIRKYSPDAIDNINLYKLSGKTVAVDASLIGGATIEIGDHIINGSIKGKLQKLQHELQA